MNVFHHVALQSLKRSPARTLVTIVGIALAAALMTVVAAFGTSLLHFLVISAENKYGDWHVSFDAVDTAFVQAKPRTLRLPTPPCWKTWGMPPWRGPKPRKAVSLSRRFAGRFLGYAPDPPALRQAAGERRRGAGTLPSGRQRGVSLSVGDTLTLSVGSRQAGGHLPQPGRSLPPGRGNPGLHHRENLHCGGDLRERPTLEPHDAPGYTLLTTAAPQGKLPPSVCSSPCITPARRRTTPPPGTAARLCTMSPCCAFWGHRRALYFKPSWSLSAAACWPLSWWGRFS